MVWATSASVPDNFKFEVPNHTKVPVYPKLPEVPQRPRSCFFKSISTSQFLKTHLLYTFVLFFNFIYGLYYFQDPSLMSSAPALFLFFILFDAIPYCFRPCNQKRSHMIIGLILSIFSLILIIISMIKPLSPNASTWFSVGTIGLHIGYYFFARFFKYFYLVVNPLDFRFKLIFYLSVPSSHIGVFVLLYLLDDSWSVVIYSSILLILSSTLTINLVYISFSKSIELRENSKTGWGEHFEKCRVQFKNAVEPYSVMEYHETIGYGAGDSIVIDEEILSRRTI